MKMKWLPLLLCLSACASTQRARVSALRTELLQSCESCAGCLERLADTGDAGQCAYACAQPGVLAQLAVQAGTPPAPAAAAAPSEAQGEVTK